MVESLRGTHEEGRWGIWVRVVGREETLGG